MGEQIQIRRARSDDYDLFVRLFPSLELDDPIPDSERFSADIAPQSMIAELDGTSVGYIQARTLKEMGHVLHVIVDAAARGQGIGRVLMRAFAERFRQQGLKTWCLNVKPDNGPALALYRRLGFEPVYTSAVLRFTWQQARPWLSQDDEIEVVTPSTDDDAVIESELGLAAGMLEARRAGGYRVVALVQAGRWCGCAAFSVEFPGAFPFRVARPELAGHLLAGLQPLAQKPNMQVVIEDDDATQRHLVAAGAIEHLRIVHMRGAL